MNPIEIIDQVPEFARLVVLEMEKIQRPQKDRMSTREAYCEYGQAWVKEHVEAGVLKVVRHGNRKMLSRSEMERVKAKENACARIVSRKKKS